MVRHIPRLPKNFRANTAYTQGRGGGTNGEYIALASSLLRSGKKPKEVEKNETHTGLDADICSGASRGSRRVGGSAAQRFVHAERRGAGPGRSTGGPCERFVPIVRRQCAECRA